LFRDFDEMRCRLRDNVNEKLKSDANSREMISNISHDLKTPITAIKGYVEGIRDGVATTDEKREKYIRTIYNKACEMDRLIDELTFYSRIDSDKIIYNFQKLNVMDYFADCVNDIKLELDELNYTLEYDNRVSYDTWVIGDAEQLKRVINNIVGNSIKYMNKKDGVISFVINEDENKVYFEIKDNGPGISSNNLPYIFDRFYRGDMSRNSKKGGSGIGLSIVKKIISDHDGEVSAESVEGEGTTIKIVMKKEKKSYEKSFDN
jgi:signal transduction histidine kinase